MFLVIGGPWGEMQKSLRVSEVNERVKWSPGQNSRAEKSESLAYESEPHQVEQLAEATTLLVSPKPDLPLPTSLGHTLSTLPDPDGQSFGLCHHSPNHSSCTIPNRTANFFCKEVACPLSLTVTLSESLASVFSTLDFTRLEGFTSTVGSRGAHLSLFPSYT